MTFKDKSWCLLIGLLCTLLLLYEFSPKYSIWKGIYIEEAIHHPELNRVMSALEQLQNPFAEIANENNRVIRWRLLFPIITHYLHLPVTIYLAIPFVGCFILLSYNAFLSMTASKDRWIVSSVALILGSQDWFFVSTGWLAYFDAWYLLALMCVAFESDPKKLFFCSLLACWVDERFLLGLPLAICSNAIYKLEFSKDVQSSTIASAFPMREILPIMAGIAPYIAVRCYVYFIEADHTTDAYIKEHVNALTVESIGLRIRGLVEGLRFGWFFAAVFLWFCVSRVLFKKDHKVVGLAAIITLLGTLAVAAVIAADVSRSVCMLTPAAMCGALILLRNTSNGARKATYTAAALALLVPANHIVVSFGEPEPIYYLPCELARFDTPPPELTPSFHNDYAVKLAESGETDAAMKMFAVGLTLDREFAPIYLNRAILNLKLGIRAAAKSDLNRFLSMSDDEEQVSLAKRLLSATDQQLPHQPSP